MHFFRRFCFGQVHTQLSWGLYCDQLSIGNSQLLCLQLQCSSRLRRFCLCLFHHFPVQNLKQFAETFLHIFGLRYRGSFHQQQGIHQDAPPHTQNDCQQLPNILYEVRRFRQVTPRLRKDPHLCPPNDANLQHSWHRRRSLEVQSFHHFLMATMTRRHQRPALQMGADSQYRVSKSRCKAELRRQGQTPGREVFYLSPTRLLRFLYRQAKFGGGALQMIFVS
mmetsp:Transcript_36736/g.77534  ORF Transcript_36736/g.77534 Transcript_36736/m.77534 type:complete len:222 (+) Transcript_36736:296-961(+)